MKPTSEYRCARREEAKAEARKSNIPLYRHWLNSPLRLSTTPTYIPVKAKSGDPPHQGKTERTKRLRKMKEIV